MTSSYTWTRIDAIEARQEKLLIKQRIRNILACRNCPLVPFKFIYFPTTTLFYKSELYQISVVEISNLKTHLTLTITRNGSFQPRHEVIIHQSSKMLRPLLEAILYETPHIDINLNNNNF